MIITHIVGCWTTVERKLGQGDPEGCKRERGGGGKAIERIGGIFIVFLGRGYYLRYYAFIQTLGREYRRGWMCHNLRT